MIVLGLEWRETQEVLMDSHEFCLSIWNKICSDKVFLEKIEQILMESTAGGQQSTAGGQQSKV